MSTVASAAELDEVNARWLTEPARLMGLRLTVLAADHVTGTFTVDAPRNTNPFGSLHGGVTCVMAETIGSLASHRLVAPEGKAAVGLQLSAHHVRAARHGEDVTVEARLRHKGRSTHVWHVEFANAKGQAVAFVTFTVAVVDAKA